MITLGLDSGLSPRRAPRTYDHSSGQDETEEHKPTAKRASHPLSTFDLQLLDSINYVVKHRCPPFVPEEGSSIAQASCMSRPNDREIG